MNSYSDYQKDLTNKEKLELVIFKINTDARNLSYSDFEDVPGLGTFVKIDNWNIEVASLPISIRKTLLYYRYAA